MNTLNDCSGKHKTLALQNETQIMSKTSTNTTSIHYSSERNDKYKKIPKHFNTMHVRNIVVNTDKLTRIDRAKKDKLWSSDVSPLYKSKNLMFGRRRRENTSVTNTEHVNDIKFTNTSQSTYSSAFQYSPRVRKPKRSIDDTKTSTTKKQTRQFKASLDPLNMLVVDNTHNTDNNIRHTLLSRSKYSRMKRRRMHSTSTAVESLKKNEEDSTFVNNELHLFKNQKKNDTKMKNNIGDMNDKDEISTQKIKGREMHRCKGRNFFPEEKMTSLIKYDVVTTSPISCKNHSILWKGLSAMKILTPTSC